MQKKISTIYMFILFSFSTTYLSFSQTVLLNENFDDNNFDARGWYDAPKGTISTAEHIKGSPACFECQFLKGQRGCANGTPGRHLFAETDELYVSYWVKYSANWEGSNRPYHPHEFNIMTNKDDIYVGPAITHLTLYIEQNEGRPLLALQDSKNVDQNCILQNNDNFIGCNGDINSYQFTENRSVAACNGIQGGYDRRDCFFYGSGYYYSARIWDMDTVYFTDVPGPYYKNGWHHVEAYLKLNSIAGGKGITDGKLRYWYDSKLLISYDNILMRTAQFPDMKLNQFLIAPYIGDGSPVDQTMWIDDLMLATSPVSSNVRENENTIQNLVIPNPVPDFITLSGYSGNIKIYDMFGREIMSDSNDFIQKIDVSSLSRGIYFLKSGDKMYKFVKI